MGNGEVEKSKTLKVCVMAPGSNIGDLSVPAVVCLIPEMLETLDSDEKTRHKCVKLTTATTATTAETAATDGHISQREKEREREVLTRQSSSYLMVV